MLILLISDLFETIYFLLSHNKKIRISIIEAEKLMEEKYALEIQYQTQNHEKYDLF